MKLERKKELAAKTLGVGKNRISFNVQRLEEVKEAITKQDIRDLHSGGAIIVKEVNGRKAIERRKTRRRVGSIKKTIRNKKREYVILTRKLRRHLSELKRKANISKDNYHLLRKEIRARAFKSKSQLKERLLALTSE